MGHNPLFDVCFMLPCPPFEPLLRLREALQVESLYYWVPGRVRAGASAAAGAVESRFLAAAGRRGRFAGGRLAAWQSAARRAARAIGTSASAGAYLRGTPV